MTHDPGTRDVVDELREIQRIADAQGERHNFTPKPLWKDAADEILSLRSRLEKMETALRYFLCDDRFQVAVGGNPIAVDAMLAEARAALQDKETGQ
jgi:hypothetical protein